MKLALLFDESSNYELPNPSNSLMPGLQFNMDSEALLTKKITVFDGDAIRDFLYVDDVSEVVIRALESKYNGPLNLGTQQGTSAREIAQTIANETGSKVDFLKSSSRMVLFRDTYFGIELLRNGKTEYFLSSLSFIPPQRSGLFYYQLFFPTSYSSYISTLHREHNRAH